MNDRDPLGLAIRLTWILLLLDPIGHSIAQVPLAIAAVLALSSRRHEWHPGLWWIAAFATALPVLEDWTHVDNHAFLRAYWCLALAIAATSRDPRTVLLANARGLIVGVFCFALLWKAVLSPDFATGSFLRFSFLTDPRFADWSALTSDLASNDQTANRELVRDWLAGGSSWPRDFVEPSRLALVARLTSWWTIAIEATVALLFVLPRRSRLARWRDAALLIFAITTYATATVETFGWLICVMGLAQCEPERRGVVRAYVAAYLVILIYAWVPWSSWLVSALS